LNESDDLKEDIEVLHNNFISTIKFENSQNVATENSTNHKTLVDLIKNLKEEEPVLKFSEPTFD
jgi:hypothetical protein